MEEIKENNETNEELQIEVEGEELENFTNELGIHERLKKLIASMILKDNYWGYVFSRIRRRVIENYPAIMGVQWNGKSSNLELCIEPKLFNTTEDHVLEKIIEHEGLHLINNHISRLMRLLDGETDILRKQFKMKLWNIATDCCVNELANISGKIKISGKDVEPCTITNYKLEKNKTAEYHYYELMKRKWTIVQVFSLDGHDNWDCKDGDSNGAARKIEEEVRGIVIDSLKHFCNKRGTLPGSLSEMLDEFLKPTELPYYQLIRKLVIGNRMTKYKKCSTRINKKRSFLFSISDDFIPEISPFPGRKTDFTFKIVVLIDTSGSMDSEDVVEGLRGIKNLIENDKNVELIVLEVDTKLQKEYKVKKLNDIQFEVKGRGGTILFPGLERAKEINPDIVLAFTDGGCENINQISRGLLPKKIIWCIVQDGCSDYIDQTGFVINIPRN